MPSEIMADQFFPGKLVEGVFHNDQPSYPPNEEWYVITIHGQRCFIQPADWVVREPDGIHHYPIKPDIFAKKYQLV